MTRSFSLVLIPSKTCSELSVSSAQLIFALSLQTANRGTLLVGKLGHSVRLWERLWSVEPAGAFCSAASATEIRVNRMILFMGGRFCSVFWVRAGANLASAGPGKVDNLAWSCRGRLAGSGRIPGALPASRVCHYCWNRISTTEFVSRAGRPAMKFVVTV